MLFTIICPNMYYVSSLSNTRVQSITGHDPNTPPEFWVGLGTISVAKLAISITMRVNDDHQQKKAPHMTTPNFDHISISSTERQHVVARI